MQSINRFVETIVGHIFCAFESQKTSFSLYLFRSLYYRSVLFHLFLKTFYIFLFPLAEPSEFATKLGRISCEIQFPCGVFLKIVDIVIFIHAAKRK